MKRLEFSEKKALAIKFIEKIKEGYRLTGPNNAFKEAIAHIENVGIRQAALYQFIMQDADLKELYQAAKQEQKKHVKSSNLRMGLQQKRELLKLIIANISQGMNIRGDTYRKNAIVEACKVLELPVVHWATVHRWLRVEHKDLRTKYKTAIESRKEVKND